MKQCMAIHWGEAFDSDEQYYAYLEKWKVDPTATPRLKWRDWLKHALSHEWQVFLPQMPNPQYAKYKAWKMRFEKYLPYFGNDTIVLIGNSTWGWFLCKWLSENIFPKKINQLHLVAACISSDGVAWEGSADFDFDYAKLAQLEKQCDEIYLYHSRDDDVVPYAQAELLKSYLPKAKLLTFETRNHFRQPAFPELLENMGVYKK